jgi:hypothetical protein
MKVRKKRKKFTVITLADARRLRTGGIVDPLQQMQTEDQQPLPLAGMRPLGKAEEDGRSVRFKQARAAIEDCMKADDFKRRRAEGWIMSQGLTSGNHLTMLTTSPIEEIKCEIIPSLQIQEETIKEDPEITRVRSYLSNRWKEEYIWDVQAREVALLWEETWRGAKGGPREFKSRWAEAIELTPTGPIMADEYRKIADKYLEKLFKLEWDRFMKEEYDGIKEAFPIADYQLSCLLFYNNDLSDEELMRRYDSFWDQSQVESAQRDCLALDRAPKQEGWRRTRKSHPGFPKEWKHAIRDSWEEKQEALKDLHIWTTERRRKDFEPYYQWTREDWSERFDRAI